MREVTKAFSHNEATNTKETTLKAFVFVASLPSLFLCVKLLYAYKYDSLIQNETIFG